MIPRQPDAIPVPWLLFWMAIGALAWAMIFASLGCATVRTPRGIALHFATCFEDQTPKNTRLGSGWPLSVRCQCLKDADARCLRAGYRAGCWRDGWNDADHDAWSVAACDERERWTP